MEKAKAIENLMRIRNMHNQRVFGAINDEEDEALAMAIEALEQQNLSDGVNSHSEREILNSCIQLLREMVWHFRIYLDWADFKPDDEEKECGYFGFSYFYIVQKLFLQQTSHSGGTSTRQKCRELGIEDWSEGVRFKLWEGEEDE